LPAIGEELSGSGFQHSRISIGQQHRPQWGQAAGRDPRFTPKQYGHAGLLEMVASYPDLESCKEGGAH
jgi:hypothetical protein